MMTRAFCAIFLLAGLSVTWSENPPAPAVDRVGFPEGYKDKYKLLDSVDDPEDKQQFIVYGNEPAAAVKKAEPLVYPYGSIIVMEIWDALKDVGGKALLDETGRYRKDKLIAIHVMRKERGFGEAYQRNRTGEWEYVSYKPDRTYGASPRESFSCAACHVKAGLKKDFIYRSTFRSNGVSSASTGGDWPTYGNDPGGSRYSALARIDPTNVSQLKIAWTYHTGALQPETDLNHKAAFEATPILVDGTLYLSTPFDQVIALDPETGTARWKFDPKVDRSENYSEVTSRGVSTWQDSQTGERRILLATIDARLICLDATTGKPCPNFGQAGEVDLTQGVELLNRGDYQETSPPAVVNDLVIVGSGIGDNRAANVERGIVRAYDARTGQLRWTWDPIPWAKENKPRTGAGNSWSVISADPGRDLVFVPTGSASPDFYGGQRPGDNRYADSVVALKASTGEMVWGFQVVHHDLWDYDVASEPALFTFRGTTPAVAVTTKIGHLFLLDRLTGKPLLPVEERAVPKSDVPGEQSSPTQPFPASPPLVPQKLSADDAWGATPADREWCRSRMAPLRSEGLFTPPSLQGSLQFPGNVGGVNWGGVAIDPERRLLVTNTNRLPFLVRLIPREKLAEEFHTADQNRLQGEFGRQRGTPYAMYREALISPSHLPCNPPPWGALTAVDLDTGEKLWEMPLGSMAPGAPGGSPNLGGPIVTAGGLVFTAAAMDTYLRVFDVETGKEIWKAELPASAQASPMTYSIRGKQYVVICAGGHGKLGTKQGDSVVAFSLPQDLGVSSGQVGGSLGPQRH